MTAKEISTTEENMLFLPWDNGKGVLLAKSHLLESLAHEHPNLFKSIKPRLKQFPASQKQLPRKMFFQGQHMVTDIPLGSEGSKFHAELVTEISSSTHMVLVLKVRKLQD